MVLSQKCLICIASSTTECAPLNTNNQQLKLFVVVGCHYVPITATRVVDMFISHQHPHTTNVEESVRTIDGKGINITEVRCNKLKARYEHLYTSVVVERFL